jgi:hypothetical protein
MRLRSASPKIPLILVKSCLVAEAGELLQLGGRSADVEGRSADVEGDKVAEAGERLQLGGRSADVEGDKDVWVAAWLRPEHSSADWVTDVWDGANAEH